MKYVLICLQSFIIISCDINKSDSKIETHSKRLDIKEELKNCKPNDSIGRNFFVKYLVSDTYYDIQAGNSFWDTTFGYKFDCSAPHSIVPSYEWSNDSVISLLRGCSNFCVINYYLIPGEKKIIERTNVIATWESKNLIARIVEGKQSIVVIENIMNGKTEKFNISRNIACSEIMACIEKAEFANSILNIKLRVDFDKKEKTIVEKFKIQSGLLER